jgi:hypothetical protein
LGSALLGWVGLSMAVHDPVVNDWVVAQAAWLNWVAPAAGAALVVAVGKLLSLRAGPARARREGMVDLAERERSPPQS